MKVYNYSEARQNLSSVLNAALKEEVYITRKDGSKFKLISITDEKRKSPLDVKGIKCKVTTRDIVDIVREGRERY